MLDALHPRHAAWGLELELVESSRVYDRYVFRFRTYCDVRSDLETVSGDYYATKRREPGARAPLLLMSPILAGPVDDYLATRFMSSRACRRGLSAFFLHQEKVILDPDRSAVRLQAWLEENCRDYLKALALLSRLPEVDPTRLGSFGVSLGGIKNVLLIAAEKRLRANVLVLAGADLAAMLETSREKLVERYLRGRKERDGLDPEDVAEEIRRWLYLEPGRLAPGIESDRVLLFLGRLDDKVPYGGGLRLRRRLGEPETWILPLGHYTAILAAPWAVEKALGWVVARLAET